jgi:outer membrane immunogenic protein
MRRSGITFLTAASLSLGLSAAAPAADMILKAPPPAPLFDWTGWYGGVNTGYSWGRSRATTTADTSLLGDTFTQLVRHDGWEASVEGGYCWQHPATMVTCIEVRYDFPRERSRTNSLDIPLTTIYNQTQVDPLLIGPHFGYLTDSNHTMWYLAGGLAVGEVGGNSTATGVGGTSTANPSTKWTAGWFVGAGIERMIDQHWSAKVEYDYVRFGSNGTCAPYFGTNYATFTGLGATSCLGGSAYDNVISVGINYHLGAH